MMDNLVDMYKQGAITPDHLAVESLHMVDPKHPELVLDVLPQEILVYVLQYAAQYDQNVMVSNYGLLPAADQVVAAREWIARAHPEAFECVKLR
jgi:hypothetical protein